eukprot:CAMPEP_0170604214 /NCGR_PEP_ID=MMETSP0224-20130122/19305_1 /TAXON_ID=285029 /ORGANISM="Togula jolla, Strain CCCM 725" /LENGTH=54 /DNA_ID=CAMNT_0010929105 /DNA_START=696 /DNA_END=860 /DNA_ORIENTATION=-
MGKASNVSQNIASDVRLAQKVSLSAWGMKEHVEGTKPDTQHCDDGHAQLKEPEP